MPDIEVSPEQVHSIEVDPSQVSTGGKPAKPQSWWERSGLAKLPDLSVKTQLGTIPDLGRALTKGTVDALEAGASGANSSIFEGGDFIRRSLGMNRVIQNPDVQQAMTAPDSLAGKVGKFVEQGVEMALPLGAVAKLSKAAKLGKAARIGAEALTAGLTAGVQSGGNPSATMLAAGTQGLLGGAQAAVEAAVPKLVTTFLDNAPRPLSEGALKLAEKYGIPVSRGAQGGSRTVLGAEKLIGSTVAPDLYEGMIEAGQRGLNRGASELSGNFALDKFAAGDNTIKTMLGTAKNHADDATAEYANLARAEADPANVEQVQTGTTPAPKNPLLDALGLQTAPTPVMEPIGLPIDMRPAKQSLGELVDDISRRMTPAQRRADPGLSAIQNILTRPDYLPASVAESDLSYLKEIMRGDASGQAKRLAGKAIEALDQQIQNKVSEAGPDVLASLKNARASWKSRSDILDTLRGLANDESGKTGQVLLANKLLQPGDFSYPALQKVLAVAPEAADDLGKSYLTDRVFKKVSADGSDFTNAKEAMNIWNAMGKRTKAALYSPDQIANINDFLELGRRLNENPNPPNTAMINALAKAGLLILHPVKGALAIGYGRKLAQVLYEPQGAASLKLLLSAPKSPVAERALQAVKAIADETASKMYPSQ